MIDPAENGRLLRLAADGDTDAEARLVRDNMPLVYAIAKRYAGRAEQDDLNQLGAIGLVKAIRRFDASFGVCFSTYAVPMIAGEIRRFLRDDGQIKLGRGLTELRARVLRLRENLTDANGEAPGVSELAERLGVPAEEVAMSLDASQPVLSLSERIGDADDGRTREETLPAPERETWLIERIFTESLLSSLPERERRILILRYFRERTQSEVADEIGVSQVQVSRLERKILAKLRAAATG